MERLGRYEILGELGRGAVGRLDMARDPKIDRLVATKVLGLAAGAGDRELQHWRQRFQRQAKAAGRLGHPNIWACPFLSIFGRGRAQLKAGS